MNAGTQARFGADEVIETLVSHGVNTFFANPGTSEIHLVDAIDRHPAARPVLCLFEGVATGAADGYARASGRAAAVLLHLGPGLANGLANLHNAAKARTPMVVIVGEHATDHLSHDSPLRSDLGALAGYAAKAVFHLVPGASIPALIQEAVSSAHAAPTGPVVVVANADVMWSAVVSNPAVPSTLAVSEQTNLDDVALEQAASALQAQGAACCLLLGGDALTDEALVLADQIAIATGCMLVSETFNARQERGAGIVPVDRIPYFREGAAAHLEHIRTAVLVGSRIPVAFFGSPVGAGTLLHAGTQVIAPHDRVGERDFLAALAAKVGATAGARLAGRRTADVSTGPLTPRTIWNAINRCLPAGTIISDEAGTTSIGADIALRDAAPHVVMNLTGGSIGQGMPVATGAAIAEPTRAVLCVQGDGGALYTLQSLWTQARENCHVVNVIFKNERYSILDHEVKRHGLGPLGPRGSAMFDLTRPSIDWTALARGMGVESVSVSTADAFEDALVTAFAARAPRLIEACMRKS